MNARFHTSHRGNDLLTGSYKNGTCFYRAQIAHVWPDPTGTAQTERLIVSLSSLNGTVTDKEVIEIARHCRSQLRPKWWPARPTTVTIAVEGQAWPKPVQLDPEFFLAKPAGERVQ